MKTPAGLMPARPLKQTAYEAVAPFKVYQGDMLVVTDGAFTRAPSWDAANAAVLNDAEAGERFYWSVWPFEWFGERAQG